MVSISVPEEVSHVPGNPLCPIWYRNESHGGDAQDAGDLVSGSAVPRITVSLPKLATPILPLSERDNCRRPAVAVHRSVLWTPMLVDGMPEKPMGIGGVPISESSLSQSDAGSNSNRSAWSVRMAEAILAARQIGSIAVRMGDAELRVEASNMFRSLDS